MSKEPILCLNCRSKECERNSEGTFSSCIYGIAFLIRKGSVEKIEPLLPVSKISRNLRHEINPVLHVIIENINKIDKTLSTKEIFLDNPLSVIIGATVSLDIFIQMITGVNEFHYSHEPVNINRRRINLNSTVNLYYSIYSIIKEIQRPFNIQLENKIPPEIEISICSDFIMYSVAVLMDNAWKHSLENSTVTIDYEEKKNDRISISFTNLSSEIPEGIELFELGVKANSETKGFGFGLFWAKSLEFHYNKLTNQEEFDEDSYQIIHHQRKNGISNTAYQIFTLKNILL